MDTNTQFRPNRLQQCTIANLITKRSYKELIIVHHVLKNTNHECIVQIERNCPKFGIKFERITL